MKLTRMPELEPWFRRLILKQCERMLRGSDGKGGNWNRTRTIGFWRRHGLALRREHIAHIMSNSRASWQPKDPNPFRVPSRA